MEYRRRKRTRRNRGGNVQGFTGLQILIPVLLLGAAVYLILGTGAGRKIRDSYAVSLIDGCKGHAGTGSALSSDPAVSESPTAEPSVSPTGETAEIALPQIDVYMLQMGYYENEESCAPYAEALKSMGAAGYVYNDNGSLRLIAAAYADEDSAENVRSRLADEGYQCTVFRLSHNGADLLITASPERMLPIKTAFSLACGIVGQIDELALDFDSQSRSAEYGRDRLAELRTNVQSASAGIADVSGINDMLGYVYDYYTDLLGMIDRAASSSDDRVLFSSGLKTLRIEASLRYSELLKSIGG